MDAAHCAAHVAASPPIGVTEALAPGEGVAGLGVPGARVGAKMQAEAESQKE